MKKTVRFLATAALFMSVSSASFAQQVIASAGAVGDEFSFTLGEAFVGSNAGFWATDAADVPTGINAVYTEGAVSLRNSASEGRVSILLPEEMIADGAYYCVYSLSGQLIQRETIATSPVTIDYSGYASRVILTVNTKKGVVATFKLTK